MMTRICFLIACLLGSLQHSFAVTLTEDKGFPNTLYPFEYFWDIYDNRAAVYIALPDRFEFGENYTQFVFSGTGVGCKITCKPIAGYHYYSDNLLLKEMQITVRLINSPSRDKHILYTIDAEATYEENGWISKSTKVFNHEIDAGTISPAEILPDSTSKFIELFGSCPAGSINFELTNN